MNEFPNASELVRSGDDREQFNILLGESLYDLTEYFEIPSKDLESFEAGHEGHDLLDWLETNICSTDQLQDALKNYGRSDLVELLNNKLIKSYIIDNRSSEYKNDGDDDDGGDGGGDDGGENDEDDPLNTWARQSIHLANLENPAQPSLPQQNSQTNPVPMMAEKNPAEFVKRDAEYQKIKNMLLERNISIDTITIALVGAGGFGKTWLATAICNDVEIQKHFKDGILWVTLGEKRQQDLMSKVKSLVYSMTNNHEYPSTMENYYSLFRDLLENRDILLVIDDVWDSENLKLFMDCGNKTVRRLITTRDHRVLPVGTPTAILDVMQESEAIQVLSSKLLIDLKSKNELKYLVKQFGYCPLILSLANNFLRRLIDESNISLFKAIVQMGEQFKQKGLEVFNKANSMMRSMNAALSLNLSINLLSENDRSLLLDLAIFPEDVEIPLDMVYRLWQEQNKLNINQSNTLLQQLMAISLLQRLDFEIGTMRLHNIIRTHLRTIHKEKLVEVHGVFLDSFQIANWDDLPPEEQYLRQYLQWHIKDGGRDFNNFLEEITIQASREKREANMRQLIQQGKYEDARKIFIILVREDPIRGRVLKQELGFLFNPEVDQEVDLYRIQNDDAERIRWFVNVWTILCKYNDFLPDLDGISQKVEYAQENLKSNQPPPSLVSPIDTFDHLSSQEKGEMLEKATLRLFRTLFDVSKNNEMPLLNWIKKEKSGPQHGRDITIDLASKDRPSSRCFVECKNNKIKIPTGTILEKLEQARLSNVEIDHWILIAPNCSLRHDLDEMLCIWEQEDRYPFNVQIWCKDRYVHEFLGLEPEVYSLFYRSEPDSPDNPLTWSVEKREKIISKWAKKLLPVPRLPTKWKNYINN
ncbi:MAG: NB-ARC domain-containing protein, partial [Magnetococcus sp. YQC-5]